MDLITEGRGLAPWFLEVEITPDVSTRDLAHDDYPESFGKVRLQNPGPAFTRTLARLYPEGLEGRSVLDCACNCGGFLFWARDAGAGECFGVDVREHWIEQAHFLTRNRVAPSDGLRFEVRDLYDLPSLGLEPFDVTLFNGVFYHLPDPLQGLRIAADHAREVLIVNTSTRTGLPDGMLAVSQESLTRAVSGVYGLNWFPTGPQVVANMLRWVGFPEVRCNWWRPVEGNPRHGRMELVAAREPETLRAFDEAVSAEPEPFRRLVETAVPPRARVLVPTGGLEAVSQPADREVVELADGTDTALVAQLEGERTRGANFLAIPAGHDLLATRPALRDHLRSRYELALQDRSGGTIYSLFG